ncbi:hypothetical protein RJ639_022496, partial [Escallonia herrerae]
VIRIFEWDNISLNLLFSVDPQIPEDDANGRTETSAAGDGSLSEAGQSQEPYEGMLFESEEAARSFYDEYAGRIGFVTRVLSSRRSERDGSIISRGLGCRGGSDNQKSDSVATQKRDRRREGCTSMILVKRETPGRWVVRKFVRDHNHPLVGLLTKRRPTYMGLLNLYTWEIHRTPEITSYMATDVLHLEHFSCTFRGFALRAGTWNPVIQMSWDERDKRIQELTAELRAKKRLSAAYHEQLVTLVKDVDGHNEHLSTKVETVRNNLKELEAKRQEQTQ